MRRFFFRTIEGEWFMLGFATCFFLLVSSLLLCGCTQTTVYENDNGARGPEKVTLPGWAGPADWPDLRPCPRR